MNRTELEQVIRQVIVEETVSVPGYGPALPVNSQVITKITDAVDAAVSAATHDLIQRMCKDEGENDSRL